MASGAFGLGLGDGDAVASVWLGEAFGVTLEVFCTAAQAASASDAIEIQAQPLLTTCMREFRAAGGLRLSLT
jgi:hypothetical protein